MTPLVLTSILPELQDGFYVDINPVSDKNSWTKVLDSDYRWRGIAITPTPMEFNRGPMFRHYVGNANTDPKKMVDAIYETHPGSMIHFIYINGVDDVSKLLNVTYDEDVVKPYSNQKVYPHLNFITMKLCCKLTPELTKQLYDQFDLIHVDSQMNAHWFVNEVMSYLL